ncbi:hypothetical protein EYC84_012041 [Monilinia fructicola]|uniref:Uncharacterized protein n=1 Tax=Monilinia fructicola TaxID=38448 RepID=A0A5M9J830_MONFR|nr:hypothetical protein EYC84_012041 [Monilinia fructicola]
MHHQALLVAGFAAFVAATPAPQNIDFAAIYAAPPPAATGPAPTATKESVSINNVSASALGAAKATALATAFSNSPSER